MLLLIFTIMLVFSIAVNAGVDYYQVVGNLMYLTIIKAEDQNKYNDGISMTLQSAKLYKGTTANLIKDLTAESLGGDRYRIRLGSGVVQSNRAGEYIIEYKTLLNVQDKFYSPNETHVLMNNEAIIQIQKDDDSIVSELMEIKNHKNIIETRVYTQNIGGI